MNTIARNLTMRLLEEQNPEVRALAYRVSTMPRAAQKLRGLLWLVERNYDIQSNPFTDVITIMGRRYRMSILDRPQLIQKIEEVLY